MIGEVNFYSYAFKEKSSKKNERRKCKKTFFYYLSSLAGSSDFGQKIKSDFKLYHFPKHKRKKSKDGFPAEFVQEAYFFRAHSKDSKFFFSALLCAVFFLFLKEYYGKDHQ